MKNPLKSFSRPARMTDLSRKKWNLTLFGLFLVQAGAIVLFSATRSVPVTLSFLTTDSLQTKLTGHPVLAAATHQLFEVNLAYLVAAILIIAAVTHLLLATALQPQYEAELKKGVSRLRWIEYAVTGGLLLTVVALLAGVYDAGSLLLIIAAGVVTSLLGWAIELHSPLTRRGAKPNWLLRSLGFGTGLLPWLVIGLYLLATTVYGSGHVAAYVWVLYVSLLILFAGFAVVLYLQYKKKGQWASYAYADRWYMLLSLLVKSALAWQVFAGVLRP